MAPLSVALGIALIVLGLCGYLLPETKGVTALIPAFFGIAFLLLGGLAFKENLRKHAMHLAAVLGLIGFIFPAVRAIPKWVAHFSQEQTELSNAVIYQTIMAVLCLVFVILCVNSFIAARRARRGA